MPILQLDFHNQTSQTVNIQSPIHHLELILQRLGRVGTVAIEVNIVEDAAIQQLNKKFLGYNQPTDVLSFPSDVSEGQTPQLGSLVISADTAQIQADQAGLTLNEEIHSLAGHGVLHLLGYHHR